MSGNSRQTVRGVVSRNPVSFTSKDGTQGAIFPLSVTRHWIGQNNQRQESTLCYTCSASAEMARRVTQTLHAGMEVMLTGLNNAPARDTGDGQPEVFLDLLVQSFKVLPLNESAPTRIPQKPSKPAPIPKKPTFYIEEDGEYEEETEQEKRQKYKQYEEEGGEDPYTKHLRAADDLGFGDVDAYLNWLND